MKAIKIIWLIFLITGCSLQGEKSRESNIDNENQLIDEHREYSMKDYEKYSNEMFGSFVYDVTEEEFENYKIELFDNDFIEAVNKNIDEYNNREETKKLKSLQGPIEKISNKSPFIILDDFTFTSSGVEISRDIQYLIPIQNNYFLYLRKNIYYESEFNPTRDTYSLLGLAVNVDKVETNNNYNQERDILISLKDYIMKVNYFKYGIPLQRNDNRIEVGKYSYSQIIKTESGEAIQTFKDVESYLNNGFTKNITQKIVDYMKQENGNNPADYIEIDGTLYKYNCECGPGDEYWQQPRDDKILFVENIDENTKRIEVACEGKGYYESADPYYSKVNIITLQKEEGNWKVASHEEMRDYDILYTEIEKEE